MRRGVGCNGAVTVTTDRNEKRGGAKTARSDRRESPHLRNNFHFRPAIPLRDEQEKGEKRIEIFFSLLSSPVDL
jgi:hypothetical protein